MVVLDVTIVNVALPSIRADLGFTETTLVWVVNAYLLTCGGFLLLGGRLGDLYGHRRVFMIGIVLFTGASLACGLSSAQVPLVIARAVQGIGGAIVDAVALALLMNLFTEPAGAPRRWACTASSAPAAAHRRAARRRPHRRLRLALGLPRQPADRRRGFLLGLSVALLPGAAATRERACLDVAGAVTVTAALMLAVYAIVSGNESGLGSAQNARLLGAAALSGVFIAIEARVAQPLMPLRLFRSTTLNAANAIGILWAAAMFAWFFISALYLQLVLGYSAMQVGLAFLPSNLIMAAFSLGLSAKMVMRFGIRGPLAVGLLLAALGLALFARAPVDGTSRDVLPGMLLLGLGAGMAFNPVLLAAMSDVAPSESGLASGIVNTSFMMGGALGLAVLASLAAAHTGAARRARAAECRRSTTATTFAFGVGAVCACRRGDRRAAAACALLPRTTQRRATRRRDRRCDGYFVASGDGKPSRFTPRPSQLWPLRESRADLRMSELDADDRSGVQVVVAGALAERVELDATLLVAREAQAVAPEQGIESDLSSAGPMSAFPRRLIRRREASVSPARAKRCRVGAARRVSEVPLGGGPSSERPRQGALILVTALRVST